MRRISRCPTGIAGLDELLGGGFPRGAAVIVAGAPGTGKTVFSAKFIYEGAKKYGEAGVYLSFLESRKEFMDFMSSLSMNFEELERKGLFKYVEGVEVVTEDAAVEVIKDLIAEVARIKAKRVVIDSTSAIIQAFREGEVREALKDMLISGLKRLGVTSLLILEASEEAKIGEAVEEFLADGVIILKARSSGGFLVREMEIRKMRGSPIPYSRIPFDIVGGEGIRLYPPVRLEEIPPPSAEVVYTLDNEYFNEALGGGINKGSQVAVISYAPKVSFYIALCIAKALASKYGGKLVVRSYAHSPMTLKSLEKSCLLMEHLMLDLGRPKKDYELIYVSINPTSRPLYVIATENRSLDLILKEDFLVADSMEIIPANITEIFKEHMNNVWVRRKLGITAFYTFSRRVLENHPEFFNIYDFIIIVRMTVVGNMPCLYLAVTKTIELKPTRPILLCYDLSSGKYVIKEGYLRVRNNHGDRGKGRFY